eukprot:SAG22_NODE_8_length_37215_cov_120.960351_10_plen_57_part_00
MAAGSKQVVDPQAAAAARRGLWVVTGGFFLTFAGYAAIEVRARVCVCPAWPGPGPT